MNVFTPVSSLVSPSSRFDVTLASIVGVLLAAGAVMVFSASVGVQGSLVNRGAGLDGDILAHR